ncbi:MAG TPA: L,D-transpeptidase family protein [Stellaceae bacterium]|nr:L,D-transpeptidase family protein [Stellaceae bacterium]
MTDLAVNGAGSARWGDTRMRCAVGRLGIRSDKREGDGATPAGSFVMRRVLYRADRENRPQTHLDVATIRPSDGWCDAPGDAAYNRPVRLPYGASAEALWRADRLYDLVVVLGWNDDPVMPGRGSAIFLHLAAPDFTPTEGCVALARADLLTVLAEADTGSRVIVTL